MKTKIDDEKYRNEKINEVMPDVLKMFEKKLSTSKRLDKPLTLYPSRII